MRLAAKWLLLSSLPLTAAAAGAASADATLGIDAFNRALSAATLVMDQHAELALWEDGGISLLPSTPAMQGKPAIAKFLANVTAQMPGARMQSFELVCHDIDIAGNWASEWCDEHQVVSLGNGKPPFDGHGRMLFVLHRGADGHWRLRREMWQPIADTH